MYVVLIGRPGVGKSTQATHLFAELELPPISTGEMLREAIRTGEATQELADCLAGGNFASDELIMELVAKRLDETAYRKGCLFDGMPRTVDQAQLLDRLLAEKGARISVAVEITAPTECLVERLLARAETEDRADDTLPAIRQRMEVYRQKTEPILKYYQDNGRLRSIDGQGLPDEVLTRLKSCLEIC